MRTGLTVVGERLGIEKQAINTLRTLCMDAIQALHPGREGGFRSVDDEVVVIRHLTVREDAPLETLDDVVE